MAKSTPAQLFAKFFRVFMDRAATPAVRAEAEKQIDAWLKRHGKTRADIQSVLAQAVRDDAAAAPPLPPSDPRDAAPAEPLDPHDTVLSLVCGAFKTYLAVNSHEYVALALWASRSRNDLRSVPLAALGRSIPGQTAQVVAAGFGIRQRISARDSRNGEVSMRSLDGDEPRTRR